jgi:Ni/Fe-hydrogenase subunit HybB-like protein
MYVLIALGVLLPTMHQSSLGSVLLIMGSKLSPSVVHNLAAAAVSDFGAGDGLRRW